MKHLTLSLIMSVALAGPTFAAIQEVPVTYKDGDTTMKGFIVFDDASAAKRPGVIVVHEWWGITKHTRDEARQLATQGYTAFVADMYGDAKTADNPKDAGALAGSVFKNPAAMQSRFNAARDALSKHATVNPAEIAAAGFCFGGSVVLDMARTGADLKAVVAFHPLLDPVVPRAEAGKIKGKLMVLIGDVDPFVKPESIAAFKAEMTAAKVSYEYITYPGAVHAFTNPQATETGIKFNIPVAYNAQADKASKAESARLLGTTLRK